MRFPNGNKPDEAAELVSNSGAFDVVGVCNTIPLTIESCNISTCQIIFHPHITLKFMIVATSHRGNGTLRDYDKSLHFQTARLHISHSYPNVNRQKPNPSTFFCVALQDAACLMDPRCHFSFSEIQQRYAKTKAHVTELQRYPNGLSELQIRDLRGCQYEISDHDFSCN